MSTYTFTDDQTPALVYGIPGLAKLLGVSTRQAARVKATGCLDKAISQRGRTIIVNTKLALQLFDSKKKHS